MGAMVNWGVGVEGGKERRECEGKCEREKGEESFGFVVNRCKWVRGGLRVRKEDEGEMKR